MISDHLGTDRLYAELRSEMEDMSRTATSARTKLASLANVWKRKLDRERPDSTAGSTASQGHFERGLSTHHMRRVPDF